VGGGVLECDERRGDRPGEVADSPVTPKLNAWAFFVVVVVVGADTAGVTARVVVVVGDGMTTPDGGSETTPSEEVSVGPLGCVRGTKTIPKIPAATNAKETTNHNVCEGRFLLRDSTSPNLV
jgi:hypothetical protein